MLGDYMDELFLPDAMLRRYFEDSERASEWFRSLNGASTVAGETVTIPIHGRRGTVTTEEHEESAAKQALGELLYELGFPVGKAERMAEWLAAFGDDYTEEL